ncbi:MAG: hypothetical protein Q8L27_00025, partial [archaeon]|nr:hypothetical protein [archaeon]
WQVRNKNDVDLEFSWRVYESNQNGSEIAIADGYSYFNTTTIEGGNIVKIFLEDIQQASKASSDEKCAESCIEDWICANWTYCNNSIQTRECIDDNNCNSGSNVPSLSQECFNENLTTNESQNNENQTILNETNEIINLTTEDTLNLTINETDLNLINISETLLDPLILESTSTNGGGGSSEGGVRIPSKEKEITEQVFNEEIKEQEMQQVNEEDLSMQRKSLVSLVGNVINIPFENIKGLFLDKSPIFYFIFLILLLALVIVIIFVVRHFRLKRLNS